MKSKKMLALALFVVLSVSTFATYVSASEPVDDGSSDASSIETTINETRKGCRHGKHGSKQEVNEPENAIGKAAAKASALADAGVTEEQAIKVKARISQLDDGTVIYKIGFIYNGQKYSYQINAETGVVIEKSAEAVSEDAMAERRGRKAFVNGEQAEKPGRSSGSASDQQQATDAPGAETQNASGKHRRGNTSGTKSESNTEAGTNTEEVVMPL